MNKPFQNPAPQTTTFRTTPADRGNIQRIIESGLAANMTAALQVSLALVAHKLVKGGK